MALLLNSSWLLLARQCHCYGFSQSCQIEGMGNNGNAWALGPLSYVNNTGASALSRGAEYLIMPTANWHNNEQYTYFVECTSEGIGWHAYMFIISLASAANSREQIFVIPFDPSVPTLSGFGQFQPPTANEGYSSTFAQTDTTQNVTHRMASAVSTLGGITQGKAASDGLLAHSALVFRMCTTTISNQLLSQLQSCWWNWFVLLQTCTCMGLQTDG